MITSPFSLPFTPDWEGFIRCLRREGTPERAYSIELLIDWEMQEEICQRFAVLEGLDPQDPFFYYRRQIALQRFLGYDYVVIPESVGESIDAGITWDNLTTTDTALLQRARGRSFVNEHRGPIASWEDFEKYPWPDPKNMRTDALDWFEENLPDDMCLIGGLVGSFYELLSFLMGYEPLCYALYEQRDLVAAISQRLLAHYSDVVDVLLQYNRVKVIWGSDDLGFRSGTLVSPRDLREFVLPNHKALAAKAHQAGRPYIMHSCGNLSRILDDLIDDVKIDGKHSFEDTIQDVRAAKAQYGGRVALLGGIDVDFLCRTSEREVRQRVRDTLETCNPGGGYMLGTGNTVTNYIPLDNYLAMLDEGRRFQG